MRKTLASWLGMDKSQKTETADKKILSEQDLRPPFAVEAEEITPSSSDAAPLGLAHEGGLDINPPKEQERSPQKSEAPLINASEIPEITSDMTPAPEILEAALNAKKPSPEEEKSKEEKIAEIKPAAPQEAIEGKETAAEETALSENAPLEAPLPAVRPTQETAKPKGLSPLQSPSYTDKPESKAEAIIREIEQLHADLTNASIISTGIKQDFVTLKKKSKTLPLNAPLLERFAHEAGQIASDLRKHDSKHFDSQWIAAMSKVATMSEAFKHKANLQDKKAKDGTLAKIVGPSQQRTLKAQDYARFMRKTERIALDILRM